MIGLLQGTVFSKNHNSVILLVGGVGYSVKIPEHALAKLTVKQKITLYTQTYVREDTLALFGFTESTELQLFEQLQTVSGIGPRTALSVVDRGVISVSKAINEGDVDFFTAIPRLGRKNAQKIIIEFKGKLDSNTSGESREIQDALLSMGFTRQEILEVTRKIDPEGSLETRIKQALKLLGKPNH